MKMPKKSSTPNNQQTVSQDPQPNRCHFETSDGRRCRMLRYGHPTLCLFHARDEIQILESHRLGAELSASLTGRFMTATDINFVLGKLFTATAQNRIPPLNAAVLAYIGQLMLHSLRDLKDEYRFEYKFESWNNMLDNATNLSNPPIIINTAPNSASATQNTGAPPTNISSPADTNSNPSPSPNNPPTNTPET